MREFIKIVESNLVPYDDNQPKHGEISGPHREGMSVQEAKQYLDSHPDGVLCHECFETEAFVAVNKYGIYVFYNPVSDRLEHWDWSSDITALIKYFKDDQAHEDDQRNNPMVNWWYNDAQEQLSITKGGMMFWDRIRNGLEVPE